MNIPDDGFYITFDSDGNITEVGDNQGTWGEKSGSPFPMELKAIEKFRGDIALIHVNQSPGRWCVIAGRAYWCG